MIKNNGLSIVIFGATGDLSNRKLLPALYALFTKNQLAKNLSIVGVGRREKTSESFRDDVRSALEKFYKLKITADVWQNLSSNIHYHKGDFHEASLYSSLEKHLADLEKGNANRLYYLATAPEHFGMILKHIKKQGLFDEHNRWVRLLVEKPFGTDEKSARALNEELAKYLREEQIYRIDHYLGKELVQNILVLRFANSIFEHLWNQKHIEHVQITVSESIGIGTRGGYYDTTGALKDMIQNHLLQLLALVTMEPPVSLSADDIRDEKLKVFKSLRLHKDEKIIRGQYVASGGRLGYREEERVDSNSMTETYVALKCYVDNWRWSNIPFYLRTGKNLKNSGAEITIFFEKAPYVLFSADTPVHQNSLTIRIQPEEAIYLNFNMKPPGVQKWVEQEQMEFCHSCEYGINTPEAYERLLYDAIEGDQTLFTRADEVEATWNFVDRVHTDMLKVPLYFYSAGSWGPQEADDFIALRQRKWKNPLEDLQ